MTKAKSIQATLFEMMGNPLAFFEAGERAQAFWSAQAAAAKHIQGFIDDWCERRLQGAAAAAECCARMVDDGGDLSVARAWTDWLTGVVERLRQDAQYQAALSAQLLSDAARSLLPAASPRPSASPRRGRRRRTLVAGRVSADAG
jgi:hypothetical protein